MTRAARQFHCVLYADKGAKILLSKHLEVALGCRYYAVQHSTKILSVYGTTNSSWFVKRVMPGLSMGYKF